MSENEYTKLWVTFDINTCTVSDKVKNSFDLNGNT